MTQTPIDPPKKYAIILLALLLLLAATYFLAQVDLGRFNLTVGLLIAGAKALLVLLYFMHLRQESAANRLASVVGLLWLGILLTLTFGDYLTRNWLFLPSHWP
jgi:cytochrome c oxidase subunit 4